MVEDYRAGGLSFIQAAVTKARKVGVPPEASTVLLLSWAALEEERDIRRRKLTRARNRGDKAADKLLTLLTTGFAMACATKRYNVWYAPRKHWLSLKQAVVEFAEVKWRGYYSEEEKIHQAAYRRIRSALARNLENESRLCFYVVYSIYANMQEDTKVAAGTNDSFISSRVNSPGQIFNGDQAMIIRRFVSSAPTDQRSKNSARLQALRAMHDSRAVNTSPSATPEDTTYHNEMRSKISERLSVLRKEEEDRQIATASRDRAGRLQIRRRADDPTPADAVKQAEAQTGNKCIDQHHAAPVVPSTAHKPVAKTNKHPRRARVNKPSDTADGEDDGAADPAPQFFTIEQVAGALRCSVDHTYRIPAHELPYSRPGKRNIYRPEDVDAYVMRKRIFGPPNTMDSSFGGSLIDSLADSVRGRSSNKGDRHV